MATLPIKQPRRIDPSLIEIGDDILIEHKTERGIATMLRGIVGKRVDSGKTRYLMTNEGATLLAWEPGKINKYKVILFGRDATPQATLFDDMAELSDRIAS